MHQDRTQTYFDTLIAGVQYKSKNSSRNTIDMRPIFHTVRSLVKLARQP